MHDAPFDLIKQTSLALRTALAFEDALRELSTEQQVQWVCHVLEALDDRGDRGEELLVNLMAAILERLKKGGW